jgi:hypothetical protein
MRVSRSIALAVLLCVSPTVLAARQNAALPGVSLGQLADVNNGAAAQPEWASRSSLSNQAREQRQTVKFDGLLPLQSSVAAVKGAATPGLLDSLAAVKDAAHSSNGGLISNPFEKQHDDRTLTLPPLNKHSGKGFVISFPSLDNGNGTLVTVPPKEQPGSGEGCAAVPEGCHSSKDKQKSLVSLLLLKDKLFKDKLSNFSGGNSNQVPASSPGPDSSRPPSSSPAPPPTSPAPPGSPASNNGSSSAPPGSSPTPSPPPLPPGASPQPSPGLPRSSPSSNRSSPAPPGTSPAPPPRGRPGQRLSSSCDCSCCGSCFLEKQLHLRWL